MWFIHFFHAFSSLSSSTYSSFSLWPLPPFLSPLPASTIIPLLLLLPLFLLHVLIRLSSTTSSSTTSTSSSSFSPSSSSLLLFSTGEKTQELLHAVWVLLPLVDSSGLSGFLYTFCTNWLLLNCKQPRLSNLNTTIFFLIQWFLWMVLRWESFSGSQLLVCNFAHSHIIHITRGKFVSSLLLFLYSYL